MFNTKFFKNSMKSYSINPKLEISERYNCNNYKVFSVIETNLVNFFNRFTLNSIIELNNSKYLNNIRDED